MRVRVVDAAPLDAETVRRTRDGYLVADAKIARIGIQNYSAGELGLTDRDPGDVIRVYRGEDEVFSTDSMATLAHRPVTVDHPAEMVTAKNWKKYAVGDTGGDVARDGDFIRVPLKVMDQRGIDAIEGGKRELSVGYFCDLDFTPGVSPKGEAYDARQTGITGNHLAICTRARAGSSCRIGDSWEPRDDAPLLGDRDMKTIMIDGVPVADVSPAAEAVINTLQSRLSDAQTSVGKLTADLATATTTIQTKDGEIAGLNAKLKDAEVTPARLQQMADARAKVITDAKKIAGDALVTDGKTDVEIKRAAVSAKLGDAAKDMADAAIDGAFLALVPVGDASNQRNTLADHIAQGGGATSLTDAQTAHAKAKADRLAHLNSNYQATAA